MAYTLEQIYEALGKIENGGTMVADLQDAIRGARDEAAKSRVEKNKILDQLNLRQGGDTEGALRNLVATLTALQNAGGDPSTLGTQMNDLKKSFDELKGKYDASEKKAKEEHDKRVKEAISSKVLSALTDGKAINPAEMSKILIGNVSVGDGDKIVYKDGDKDLSVTDGVAGWLKANPWAVKADVQTGAGGGSGSQGFGGAKYTMNDLKTMSRDEINAHWDEISKGVVAEADKK